MVSDYYEMLGVDIATDRAGIEEALAKSQPAWSSGTRNPKNKHRFQSYLDQIPAIRRTLLGDPAARAAYDAELLAHRRAERDRKLDRLQRLVRLRAAKGGLTVTDRTLLRDEAARIGLSHDDLDRMVESIPAQPEAPSEDEAADPPVDALEPAIRRQIRIALEHLGRRDLYEVLGVRRDAPGREIAARADEERQRWMHKTQVTAEKNAWLEAITFAQSHLGTDAARGRYDRTLVVEAEEALVATIGFSLQGMGRLDRLTRAALVDEATGLGIAPDRANRLIDRHCRSAGIALDAFEPGPAPARVSRLVRCRSCEGLTEVDGRSVVPGDADCRHCRLPLKWDCPVCQKPRWADEPRCVCGFSQANREPFLRHFEAAQQAHRAKRFDDALGHLERAQDFAPAHVGTRKGIEKIRERLAQIARARSAFEVEKAGKNLVAARAAIEAWGRLADPTAEEVKAATAEVLQGLRDAFSLTSQAKAIAASDPQRARQLYQEALGIAADLPEAREGLRRCPPEPPVDLRAEFDGERVRLRWSAPANRGLGAIGYRVLRKRGGTPANAQDGVVVADVQAPECLDAGVAAGEVYGYAVFSRRGEVSSLSGATTAPLLVLGEVTELRLEATSREVQLFWKTPPAAAGVKVVRKAGAAPSGPEDGEPIDALRDRAFDRDVREDRVYHYGVYVAYRTPDGRVLHSRGLVAAAMPHAPALPVEELTLTPDEEGRLNVGWAAPARGDVRILRTAAALGLPSGTRLDPDQARGLAGVWLDPAGAGRAVDPSPPKLGVCYYTAITSWAGTFTVGKSLVFSCLPDPCDLRALRVPGGVGKVHLRWRWSPQGGQALVLAKAGSHATGPDDPNAIATWVLEADYSRAGYQVLQLPTDGRGPWYLSVRSVAVVEGERVISAGLEPTSRTVLPGPHPEVTVSYSLRPARFPGRSWHLTFRTDPPGAMIPPTVLIAHPRTVPLTVDDGEFVDQFPSTRDGASFRLRPKNGLANHRARLFPDPSADPAGLTPIRIKHPEPGGTRV